MGASIRAQRWDDSSIGNPEQWPPALRTVLNMVLASPFPMMLWWGPERAQFYNDAFCQYLPGGYNPVPTWGAEQTARVLKGEAFTEEHIFHQGISCELSYSPVHDEAGNIAGVLIVCRKSAPVLNKTGETENRKLIETLRANEDKLEKHVLERTADLKRSNTELEQFAYITSHDLQEPLRKIGTFTEMLENSLGPISDQSRKFLRKISESSSRMRRLILDVLNYSRLLSPQDSFTDVDLNKIAADVLNDFELSIAEKNAVVHVGPLPVIQAVPLQINQLFTNLVSNALKFNNREKVEIWLNASQVSPEESIHLEGLHPQLPYCRLEFRDNGIGFDQQYAEQIFTIFQRLHNHQEYPGTGIGLSLCKKIALNHQGNIFAHSCPGEGTSFHILLPFRQTEA